MMHSLKMIWDLFGDFKNQAIILLLLVITSSFLEAASIGLLLPILDLVIYDSADSVLGNLLMSPLGGISTHDSLVVVLLVFFIFILLKNIFIFIKINVHGKFSFGMRGIWMSQLMQKYVDSDYNYILEHKHGELISNVLVETEKAQFCLKYLVQAVSSFLLTIFMIVVMLNRNLYKTLCFTFLHGGS